MVSSVRSISASLRGAFAIVATASLLAACGSGNGGNTGGAGGQSTSSTTSAGGSTGGTGGENVGRPPDAMVTVDLQGRAYDLKLPSGYDASKPAPLLLELHGFTDHGSTQAPWDDEENANQFAPEADKRGVILALPHSTVDPILDRYFWNATDSCCDLDKLGTNDIGYLMAVIEDIKAKYAVDEKRIFAFGHSNGGFMVNRMACDQASKIAGIVSLAGATYKDQTKCAASAPVAFLQVHGDADQTVLYAGGPPINIAGLPVAPGALETTQDWAAKNKCSAKADTSAAPFDIVTDLEGDETKALEYEGCEGNGAAELWTIHLGPHSPKFNASWAPKVLDFLLAHPKP
ncbi:Hypothetical protein A7982_12126 [Minicystis rosea]|nr:Hypothetical protein A7982_12126 [Minicystis rosea]